MATSTTEFRLKAVRNALADTYSRVDGYAIDRCVQAAEAQNRFEKLEVADIGALTVLSDGSAGGSAQSVSKNVLSLEVNRHPAILINMSVQEGVQDLAGAYVDQLAISAAVQLKNSMDDDLLESLVTSTAYDSSGTYHVNAGAGSITAAHLATAKAMHLERDGAHDLAFVLHPRGESDIVTISDYVPNQVFRDMGPGASRLGALGLPVLGMIHGIPVFLSNGIPRQRTIASTAWDISSNVLTITVPTGHGVTPGTKVTFDTVTAGGDMSTATAVDSVTATTLVINHTASDGSATEAGTVTVQSTENLLVDFAHVHVSQQVMPQVRMVPKSGTTDSEMQVSSLWGFVARSGRAVVVHTSV